MPEPELPSPIAAEEIFRVTAALPAAERAAYLDAACEGQPEVRARVGRMLEVQGIGAVLQHSPDETVPPEIEAELARLKPEEGGERIGNYKLLQQIGEGGFGIVWMAEQIEPVRRRVALKIIKLGMDTKEVIARFEQERQALAMMDHPNIAKVFDAGATQYGRPFFVMELVRGIRITDYCDQNNLPTAERLGLFIAVCHAVQHAHQKGIIHRDLKPSNILVTLHDGVPVPKVIDFGVAKATQSQRLTDLTLFTQFEQMIGTPLYMSPEQAEMSGLDIDTRSDIYSLGVLLYELLAGRTPFDPEELMRKGHDEIRRVIREQEPPKPSTALHTMAVELRTAVAQHRQADGAKLVGLIRGDLDWIVMKALEKDRTRRYETANGLALDIKRHLDSEPVLARPASTLYRFRRLIRRNKLAFAAASSVAAALIIGLAVSTWSFFRERAALKLAEANEKKATLAAAKSQQTSKFMGEMLSGIDPDQAMGRDITILKEILDRAAQRVETELKDQPEVEAELRFTIGDTYRALGLYPAAQPHLEKTLAIRERTLGLEHRDTLDAMRALARLIQEQGKFSEGEALFRQASDLSKRVFGPEHPETLAFMNDLAFVNVDQSKYAEADVLYSQTLEIARRVLGPDHRQTAHALFGLGLVYQYQGKLVESETLHRQGWEMCARVFGPEHPDTLRSMHNLATVCFLQEKLAEAETLYLQTVDLRKRVLGLEHPFTLNSMGMLATVYWEQGKRPEAQALHRQTVEMNRRVRGTEHPATLKSITSLVRVYRELGNYAEAKALCDEALEANKRVRGPEHPETMTWMNNLAAVYEDEGKATEAEALFRQTLEIGKRVLAPNHPETLRSMQHLVTLSEGAGRWEEALTLLADCSVQSPKDTHLSLAVAALQAWLGQEANYAATCRRLLEQAKDTSEATTADRAAKAYCLRPSSDPALLEQALKLAKRAVELGKEHKYLPYFRLTLGMVEYRTSHAAAADQALAAAEQSGAANHFVHDPARLFRAMSLFQQGKPTEARKLFAETEAQIKILPTDEPQLLKKGASNDETIILWLAYKEAKALLQVADKR